ncbi:MAG: glutaminyl-peptide cyclotransferase [Smithellaceae bacterium]|nr:glutaminyl-peptide cyclotransferase [Smithellaceae bacterium]
MIIRPITLLFLLIFAGPGHFGSVSEGSAGREKTYGFKIINTYPHDPAAFTQGLIFHEGALYEGTGLYGRSTLRRVTLSSGRVERTHRLLPNLFGEGIAICRGRLYQLTWQSRVGFIYEPEGFRQVGSFAYATEGWGLTCDGANLIMSDGTSTLRFLDPGGMRVIREMEVRSDTGPVSNLNELEYVKGEIYANIWNSDQIARISPRTGKVLGWIDLQGLKAHLGSGHQVDVLNGIAYDKKGDRLFVTGKFWPKLFEIELVPLGESKK